MLLRGIIVSVMLVIYSTVFSQESSKRETEIDFLSSYYEQDGDHSAVAGGQLSEELTNFSSNIIINIPYKEKDNLNIVAGFDMFTMASTQYIEYGVIFDESLLKSGASSRFLSGASTGLKDVRVYLNAKYKLATKNADWSFSAGVSKEYDVTSVNGGISYGKGFFNDNTYINLSYKTFYDKWVLIMPSEFKNNDAVKPDDDVRLSNNLVFTLNQVVSKRLQLSFILDLNYQSGLLSTPFHRVFTEEAKSVPEKDRKDELYKYSKVEKVKDTRIKYPIGVRAHYYLNDYSVLKVFYRLYTDSWGINAHTAEIELPIKLSRSFIVYPFYRFHTQTQADFFAPYAEHKSTAEYCTSDWDLAAFDSHKYGLGLKYHPVKEIMKYKSIKWNSIGTRASIYDRNDGLNAWIISFSAKFSF